MVVRPDTASDRIGRGQRSRTRRLDADFGAATKPCDSVGR